MKVSISVRASFLYTVEVNIYSSISKPEKVASYPDSMVKFIEGLIKFIMVQQIILLFILL